MTHVGMFRGKLFSHFVLRYLLLLLAIPLNVFGQEITVSGVVTDSNKEAVIGATVLLKGTSTGTVADIDGNYKISVPADGILVFSSVGYTSQEVSVNGKQTINVTLVEDVELLDEVVVVGYGTVKKSDLTGSVGKVTTEELTQLSTTDIGQAIAGRVAGVDVISNSGAPGAGTKIRVRGYGTINSSDPLYMVFRYPI